MYATRSRSRTPVHVAAALQPSTQVIGSETVRCGNAASSATVSRTPPAGPLTSSRYAGSRARSTTPALIADLLTGSPCGPMSGRLGASTDTRDSGRTVWPTVANVTATTAAPAAESRPRRVSPAAGADATSGIGSSTAAGGVSPAAPPPTPGVVAP